jgi:hypothetical protein
MQIPRAVHDSIAEPDIDLYRAAGTIQRPHQPRSCAGVIRLFANLGRLSRVWKNHDALLNLDAANPHARRPGYVHFKDVPGIFISAQLHAPDDPDIQFVQADQVWIDHDGEADDDPVGTESSGLAPQETLEVAFDLYHPEALAGRLGALRYQRQAIDMQAQFLPYSYTKLTTAEVRCLYQRICAESHTFLASCPRLDCWSRVRLRIPDPNSRLVYEIAPIIFFRKRCHGHQQCSASG